MRAGWRAPKTTSLGLAKLCPGRHVVGQRMTICRGFSQKIICATASIFVVTVSFAFIWARMFWGRHNIFPKTESIMFENEKMLSVMQKILSAKEKMLSATQKILVAKEKTFSIRQKILTAKEKISSVKETIFCIPDSAFFVIDNIFSVTNTMLGEGQRSFR
jgi:hypothetical protein